MQVWLNHSTYPSVDMATYFAKEQHAGVYKSFYDFASRYYGIDNLLTCSGVSPTAFKTLYPIHIFDVSKQSERLTGGVVGLTVRMEFSANVPANTQAYVLVISDRMLKFKCDGSKMSVLFYSSLSSKRPWTFIVFREHGGRLLDGGRLLIFWKNFRVDVYSNVDAY